METETTEAVKELLPYPPGEKVYKYSLYSNASKVEVEVETTRIDKYAPHELLRDSLRDYEQACVLYDCVYKNLMLTAAKQNIDIKIIYEHDAGDVVFSIFNYPHPRQEGTLLSYENADCLRYDIDSVTNINYRASMLAQVWNQIQGFKHPA